MDSIEAKFNDPEAELDTLLGELNTAFKIVVKREEPDWCAGTLGTFDFDRGDQISTDWLEDKFGGLKLQIKILDTNNQHITSRRVLFPTPPRRDGIEIVRGPNGPITVLEAKAMEPAPPQQDNQMVGMLEKLLTAQQTQANSMTTMLLGRVQGLETLLTNKLTEPAPANPAIVPPVDPQSQMRNTLETVKAIEELRGAIGGGEEGESYNPLYDKIIDKLVDKFTAEPQPKQQQQQTNTRGDLPPGTIIRDRELSDLELAEMVKSRLKNKSEEEKDFLLSHVFEDEDEETPAIAGQEDNAEVDSLLTQEDQEVLEVEETTPENPPNESQTV